MVRSLGADRVIDYTTDDYTELVRDQHVLFDNAGNRGWRRTSRVLAPGGVERHGHRAQARLVRADARVDRSARSSRCARASGSPTSPRP